VGKFKVFIGVLIFVAIKKVPHMKLHWSKSSDIFWIPAIINYMTKRRMGDIFKCIHLVDNNSIVIDKIDLTYDKFAKISWLVETCNELWAILECGIKFMCG
jgi:hypothetical protein